MRGKDNYIVTTHPFGAFVPENTKFLIIGTFPTTPINLTFEFFYSSKNNNFWRIIEQVFNHAFLYNKGIKAIEERKLFLNKHKIGIIDMHQVCYRKNNLATDENLFPIVLTDVFLFLEKFPTIKRLILTSRSEIFGTLGLLKTYFIQKNATFEELEKRKDKILIGSFMYKSQEIEIMVPYSPSSRLNKENFTSFEELVKMYKSCFSD